MKKGVYVKFNVYIILILLTVVSAILKNKVSDMLADHNDKQIQLYVRGQKSDHAKHINQRTF